MEVAQHLAWSSFIINNRVSDVLTEKETKVYKTFVVGEYMTSIEMQDFYSLLRLDDQPKELWMPRRDHRPGNTAFLRVITVNSNERSVIMADSKKY